MKLLFKQRFFSWLDSYDIYDEMGNTVYTVKGQIKKELTLFKPSFILDYNDWKISGNFWEWDYEIIDSRGIVIGDINKELFNFTDTYSLTISDPRNAIYVLMIALAIDAQKCSNNS